MTDRSDNPEHLHTGHLVEAALNLLRYWHRYGIHIHVHMHDAPNVQLDRIEVLIQHNTGEILMALSAESKALIDKMNTETTKISDRIDKLLANPNTSEADFRAALQPIADHLDVLGTDPNNPVPPLPPVTP